MHDCSARPRSTTVRRVVPVVDAGDLERPGGSVQGGHQLAGVCAGEAVPGDRAVVRPVPAGHRERVGDVDLDWSAAVRYWGTVGVPEVGVGLWLAVGKGCEE